MGKDIDLRPASEIEQRPRRDELETSFGQFDAIFPGQPDVELLLEAMKMAHVTGGIFALCVGDIGSSPVAGLLLLRKIGASQLLDQILEAMPVGIGADQPRSGPRAIEWRSDDSEIGAHDGHIETGEMKQLQTVG